MISAEVLGEEAGTVTAHALGVGAQYRTAGQSVLKLAVIEVPERGFIIELHEPDQNPSTFREFLDKPGNGLHHLAFQVGEARDAVVAELEATGYPVRNVGIYPGGLVGDHRGGRLARRQPQRQA